MDDFLVQLVDALAITLGVLAPLAALAIATTATCAQANVPCAALNAAGLARRGERVVAVASVRPDTARMFSRLSSPAPPGRRADAFRHARAAADRPGTVPGADGQ